jgi:hypothetical protein
MCLCDFDLERERECERERAEKVFNAFLSIIKCTQNVVSIILLKFEIFSIIIE